MFFTRYDTVTFNQLREYRDDAPVRSKHLIEITSNNEYKAYFKGSPTSSSYKKSRMPVSEHAKISTLMLDSKPHTATDVLNLYLEFRIARKYRKAACLKKKYKPDVDSKLVR